MPRNSRRTSVALCLAAAAYGLTGPTFLSASAPGRAQPEQRVLADAALGIPGIAAAFQVPLPALAGEETDEARAEAALDASEKALQAKLGTMSANLEELQRKLTDIMDDGGIPTPVLGIGMLSVIVVLVLIVSGLVIARGLLDDETGGEL
eukprot:TRINITY_DN100076_c0_g1_i1.p1 TRINITY_DN100076_c0_g1~~TRINITY_DN100076_c0_g1_i1.p1  ORF type:complete len:150 (-),score=32.01 TRINITY_DN100076_c0_g1_i1:80-529(-)